MRDPDRARSLREARENARYLPGVRLHERVRPTAALADLADADAALLVVPAQTVRAATQAVAAALPAGAPPVVWAHGIERGARPFPSDGARGRRRGPPAGAPAGPGFAGDGRRGLPAAVTLACAEGAIAGALAEALSGPSFRLYRGTDIRGVEIGGAAKNVLAIACGAVVGRGLGESAKAALTARGFAELMRFARACGGRPGGADGR